MTRPGDQSGESGRIFDLEERTAPFGSAVINFVKKIPKSHITAPLVSQLVRSATSVGANYGEADEADTHKDFRYKIALCKKECRETRHWLRMLATAHEPCVKESRMLWRESKELTPIFAAILRRRKE